MDITPKQDSPRLGRPPVADNARRRELFTVCCNKPEAARIRRAAKKAKRPVSVYIRERALGGES